MMSVGTHIYFVFVHTFVFQVAPGGYKARVAGNMAGCDAFGSRNSSIDFPSMQSWVERSSHGEVLLDDHVTPASTVISDRMKYVQGHVSPVNTLAILISSQGLTSPLSNSVT